ncbi:sugar transferase [Virgibacillus sp. CBA3643]
MIIVSIIVLIKMSAPVTFKQKRPGLGNKPFYITKFRTMTNETDEYGDLLPNSERMTKTGNLLRRLSLDELPQLFNVLKGDLSLVGPRPLLMDYLDLYTTEQARRHEVKPGITGWAQVNGRNAITWEEKFKYDVWYVDNRSFLLDIKILFMTVAKVIKSDGVNKTENVTMERFKGTGTDD